MNSLKLIFLLNLLFFSPNKTLWAKDEVLLQTVNEDQQRLRAENQQLQQQLKQTQQLLEHLQHQIDQVKALQQRLPALADSLAHPCSSCTATTKHD